MDNTSQTPIANNGIGYFLQGFKLIKTPGIRRFVFVPLLINCILFSTAFYFLLGYIAELITYLESWLPDILSWLIYIAKPILYVSTLIVFSLLFATIGNWLAAPFNGLLAEKIEDHLCGNTIEQSSLTDVIKDIPRALTREWRKFVYYLPRAIGFFLILLMLPVIGQIVWIIFNAWMMAVQYCDYAFDNHKIDFDSMLVKLGEQKGKTITFGIAVTTFALIPLLNLVLMPVAICGATAMWVDHFKKDALTCSKVGTKLKKVG